MIVKQNSPPNRTPSKLSTTQELCKNCLLEKQESARLISKVSEEAGPDQVQEYNMVKGLELVVMNSSERK